MSTKEQGRIIRKFSQYEIYEKNQKSVSSEAG